MQQQLDLESPQLVQHIAEAMLSQRSCFIGKYQICGQLGAGGFARVYKCSWKGNLFALKVYMYKALKDKYPPQAYHKLKGYIDREAELMQECRSEHVVKCFQTFASQCYKFLVLQYCKEETLKDFLIRKGGTLDEDTAIAILQQICLGLSELHKRRIVHRDLKLQNIMVANGVCKIIDLGLAKKIEEQSEITMTNVGTNYTKAPQIKNQERSGLKADIYSIGIIYLILISDCDYNQRNRYNFYYDQKRLFRRLVSEHSKDFIRRTLEVDQFSRMGWQDLLKHPLFADLQPQNSTFSVVDVSFRSIVLEQSLADNFLEEPLLRTSHLRSTIFEDDIIQPIDQGLLDPIYEPSEQPQKKQLLLTQLRLQQPTLIQSQVQDFQYSDSTRFYYLQCQKAQFTFDLLRQIDKLGKQTDQSQKIILQYLLSMHAVSLLDDALVFYEQNHFTAFVEDVARMKKQAMRKYEGYKRGVSRMLSNVKTAFIHNEILRNYDRLKSFLDHSNNQNAHLNEEHIILVSFYLQRLAAKSSSKKMKLLSYKEVMLISLQDVEGSSFSAKVAQISAKYQY